tara:strand:- start:172 stop:741 length:570 start_codon:yes stop_codon:yes gene_type:complete
MADNYYSSKTSSSGDVATYWAQHEKAQKRKASAGKVAGKVSEFMMQDYLDTKKLIEKGKYKIPSKAKAMNPFAPEIKGAGGNMVTNPEYLNWQQNNPQGLLGKLGAFAKNPTWAGLEKGVASTIASPLTTAGNLATSAGLKTTGGLLTGASTAVQGALTSMGPVGWALLAGGALMLGKGRGGGRNKRRY